MSGYDSHRFNLHSSLMRIFLRLGLPSVAWSLRRLHVPIEPSALCLEVGSGGNPYFRSNVLLDAYIDTRQRHHEALIADRPTVIGKVENLPFKDKAFDFVIASHVLEHSSNPEVFLSELMRVGKSGYIEVPDALMERLNPYLDHRLELTLRKGTLRIRKKSAWCVDPQLDELYQSGAGSIIATKTIPKFPFDFHVRMYWESEIDFEILNPDANAAWPPPASRSAVVEQRSMRHHLSKWILSAIRRVFSQNKRNNALDVAELLRCPNCKSADLTKSAAYVVCCGCARKFAFKEKLFLMELSDDECSPKGSDGLSVVDP